MTCEELITKIQDLISKGTISPHADIGIELCQYQECYCGKELKLDSDLDKISDVELCYKTSYNKLVLI